MENKCPKHPKYKVMREPTSGCLDCRVIWLEKQFDHMTKIVNHMIYYGGAYVGF